MLIFSVFAIFFFFCFELKKALLQVMMQIMSNGIFKSPIHRVVTNTEKGRMSLVMFCFPNPNKEIEPVKGLVTGTRPRLYKTMKDYTSIVVENYQKGRRPIEAAKI